MTDERTKPPVEKWAHVELPDCVRCCDSGIVYSGGFNCAGKYVEHKRTCRCGARHLRVVGERG